ncbi:cysteine synthase a [Zalerion maritima]|uniref:Cysteine synthase 2 n=1 Tax=Zalerion maritima TaxID=339359 RepID=A0AAD5RTT8_9PEZI|nr:cysteine synthase a [Zalerion maritima]
MSLSAYPKAYGTAAITVAFLSGAILTLGFKDLYPDLEQRYQRNYRTSNKRRRQSTAAAAAVADSRRTSLFFMPPVELEDHESDLGSSTANLPARSPHPQPLVSGLEGTIGNTPLLELKSLSEATRRTIVAKAEFLNGAGGSPKDRVALSILRAAEASGHLVPGRGDWVYEGTVGSTGISLATLATALGYHAHIFMPDDQAVEKSNLLLALGATVERVPLAPITDPNHFVNLARTRARLHAAKFKDGSHGFFADQFENEANWKAHFETTGPEIQWQTGGRIEAFVCGAGTGGTISGVAKYLKEGMGKNSGRSEDGELSPGSERPSMEGRDGKGDIKIVLADPQGSGLYNKIKHGVMFSMTEREGTRRRQQVDSIVEGVGITRLTHNFEVGRELIDDAVRVTDEHAMKMAQWLVEHDGIFCGSSTAVNCVGAIKAAMMLPEGSTVVTLLCDSGNRHLSKFWRLIKERKEEKQEDLLGMLGIDAPPVWHDANS